MSLIGMESWVTRWNQSCGDWVHFSLVPTRPRHGANSTTPHAVEARTGSEARRAWLHWLAWQHQGETQSLPLAAPPQAQLPRPGFPQNGRAHTDALDGGPRRRRDRGRRAAGEIRCAQPCARRRRVPENGRSVCHRGQPGHPAQVTLRGRRLPPVRGTDPSAAGGAHSDASGSTHCGCCTRRQPPSLGSQQRRRRPRPSGRCTTPSGCHRRRTR